jgi:hypothetical protein
MFMKNDEPNLMDAEVFEKAWLECNEKIVDEIMANSDIQHIKEEVRGRGHVTDEHKDQFIRKVNEIKNKQIEAVFGEHGSERYEMFVRAWENWQKLKGKDRPQPENMFEENINHLLYGSTPNPDLFLRDFNIYTDVK